MTSPVKSLTDCFQEGADGRAAGLKLEDNPYCIRTEDHAEWAAGWTAIFDLDEEDDPGSTRDRDPELASLEGAEPWPSAESDPAL